MNKQISRSCNLPSSHIKQRCPMRYSNSSPPPPPPPDTRLLPNLSLFLSLSPSLSPLFLFFFCRASERSQNIYKFIFSQLLNHNFKICVGILEHRVYSVLLFRLTFSFFTKSYSTDRRIFGGFFFFCVNLSGEEERS